MNREDCRDLLARLAPPEPPCFNSRLEWLEWLDAASSPHASTRETMPLVSRMGKLQFNAKVDFCCDCLPSYKREMEAARRCRPSMLADAGGA